MEVVSLKIDQVAELLRQLTGDDKVADIVRS